MDTEKTKPCPFCGGGAFIEVGRNGRAKVVTCGNDNCGLFGHWIGHQQWNRRSGDATESAELHVNPAGMPG